MAPRLVRRAPLAERIKAYLDPVDWIFWLSEELNSADWEDFAKDYATPFGVALNILFMIARANSERIGKVRGDDVFGDYYEARGTGWWKWLMNFLVLVLTTFSLANAFYTFYRKRHYRLFEQPIETPPITPSARRVRVDSSPMASSPLRFLQDMIGGTAQDRAHPDATRDVWEVAVWDPNPLCLRTFCLFSPGHVLLYYLFLPVSPTEPRPSVRVVVTIIVAALLAFQLRFLRTFFSQQGKDSAIIHRQVLNEYDTKFVHPQLQRPVRDVATQTPPRKRESGTRPVPEVEAYTPTTLINRGFEVHPNPAYSAHIDPDHQLSGRLIMQSSAQQTPSLRPQPKPRVPQSVATTATEWSSPIRQPNSPGPFRQPQFRQSYAGTGDGGSLGAYTHARSPLRKASSMNFMDPSEQRRREGSPTKKRDGSPLKRISTPGGFRAL